MTRRILLLLTFVLLAVAAFAAAQSTPRFHRYAQTRLDDTTTLDMVKDAASGTCWLVYVKRDMVSYRYSVHSPATLGTVPCEPLPVR